MLETLSPNIEVNVKVVYVPSESRPDQNYFFFAYKIQITNKSSAPVQLMSRHWTISDARGVKEEVRGPGVVGVQPKIQPGASFEYDSACPLTTNTGSMKGAYHMTAENGEVFQVAIPEFYLIAPMALH
jgi:Uncharacterized protein affecting Mg2+/Co2+ transport